MVQVRLRVAVAQKVTNDTFVQSFFGVQKLRDVLFVCADQFVVL
jgi:hypothetical protein